MNVIQEKSRTSYISPKSNLFHVLQKWGFQLKNFLLKITVWRRRMWKMKSSVARFWTRIFVGIVNPRSNLGSWVNPCICLLKWFYMESFIFWGKKVKFR